MARTGQTPRTKRRAAPPVRFTILATVLILTAIALATAGITAAVLQDRRVHERLDFHLTASVEEFRTLAAGGINPSTGAPFQSSAELVRAAIAGFIPARNEGVIGVVDGKIQYTSAGAPIALERDPQLVAEIGPILDSTSASFRTIRTDITTYRIAAIPITEAGEPTISGLVLGYDLTSELSEFRQVFTTYAVVAFASLVVVGLVGWIVAGRLLRPVRTLAETARAIGRDDLSERIPVSGNDDLSQMTRAVNEMLERLEHAFAAQRALVGDVSHELRTPLTVVRGHLELLDPHDIEEVQSVQALVLDEVSRMNRVVDDLTTLASVEQPGFTRAERVEAGILTDEVFDKAIALGPRTWTIVARAEASIRGDRQRLTQAWLQLASNAEKFSTPGSRISLGSSVHDGDLHLWVEDAGIGIASDDLSRIFERFERAGERSTRGSGLGLPIVRAIAHAHGGRIIVDSSLGVGSTFTLIIPGATSHREELL